MQAELKQPRFEEGLEGVLALANSVSLTDILQAADLDVVDQQPPNAAEATVQGVGSLVSEAADIL